MDLHYPLTLEVPIHLALYGRCILYRTKLIACFLILETSLLQASLLLKFDGNFGKSISVDQPYATFNLLSTSEKSDRMLFSACNFSVINKNYCATNLGLGMRALFPSKTLGLNFFYDQLKERRLYHQIGFGLELLGVSNDFRMNLYLPITGKSSVVDSVKFDYPGGYIVSLTQRQVPLEGMDVEWAKRFQFNSHINALLALGAYGYAPCPSASCIGGRIRLMLRFNRFLYFGAVTTYDSVFHSLTQGVIALTIPLGENEQNSSNLWVDIPLYRQNIIVRGKKNCNWWTNY